MADIATILRDGEDVNMPALRSFLATLDNRIGATAAGMTPYATVSALNASSAPDGTLAVVYANNGSPSDPANGVYQRQGGAWVAATWYFSGVSTAVQPLVDQAQSAVADAETLATAAITAAEGTTAEARAQAISASASARAASASAAQIVAPVYYLDSNLGPLLPDPADAPPFRPVGLADGRKAGEPEGAGTGIMVYSDGDQWLTTYDNSVVTIPVQTVGGQLVGSAGGAGTIYDGYTLSWGDNFSRIDIVSPSTPRGRYFTTRTYLPGARGSDTLLGTLYDTDPLHTGHNDSNRGYPVGYDNMRIENGVLVLQARRASEEEMQHFEGGGREQVAAMIGSIGAVGYFPAAAGEGDTIIEARLRYSPKASNPVGWHPTLWSVSATPVISRDSDEIDFEGSSQGAWLHRNNWRNDTFTTDDVPGMVDIFDGNFHTVTLIESFDEVRLYIDGVLTKSAAWSANALQRLKFWYLTNHIFAATFHNDTYDRIAWLGDPDGATVSINWCRVWRRSARQHFAPLLRIPNRDVPFGGSVTFTLPSKMDLWGDATVTEYVQAVMNEENEPGASHTEYYLQFPEGVEYDASTRQMTVAPTSTKAGRLNFVMHGYKPDGSTCEPARFAVNVGPVINLDAIHVSQGDPLALDIYAACDVGQLVPKTLKVTGLPLGLSFSPTSGFITGTPTNSGYTATLTVTCTNSAGQTATKQVTLTVAAAPSYAAWTGPGWYDASSGLVTRGAEVTALANRRVAGESLSAGGAARNRIRIPAGRVGRDILRITRDVTGTNALNEPRFSASDTDAVSAMFVGTDRPYTAIVAYMPTDANTGFIWSVSDTVDATNARVIAAVRRSTTASSVRRGLTTAAPNDVAWGSGQPAFIPRVLAIRHTGTAVTVWDTSLTKAVNAAPQDVGTFGRLYFRLFASAAAHASPPALSAVQCSLDFYEIVVDDTPRTDVDVQQAITDMAARWNIPLT